MTVKPFTSVERAVLALFERDYTEVPGDPRVGGNFPGEVAADDYFIEIDKVGGRSDRFEGDFVLDIGVYSGSYSLAESVAFELEALLLRYPHVVEVDGKKVIFDYVEQNQVPAEAPWDDDAVHRLLATYVITARRR